MTQKNDLHAKVYDRPERTGPSPVLLAVATVIVLIVAYFVYQAMHRHTGTAPAAGSLVLCIPVQSLLTKKRVKLTADQG